MWSRSSALQLSGHTCRGTGKCKCSVMTCELRWSCDVCRRSVSKKQQMFSRLCRLCAVEPITTRQTQHQSSIGELKEAQVHLRLVLLTRLCSTGWHIERRSFFPKAQNNFTVSEAHIEVRRVLNCINTKIFCFLERTISVLSSDL